MSSGYQLWLDTSGDKFRSRLLTLASHHQAQRIAHETQNITTLGRLVHFPLRNDQSHSYDVGRQAAPTVTRLPPNIPRNASLVPRWRPVSNGKAQLLLPTSQRCRPWQPATRGASFEGQCLLITKHPRHSTAIKDRAEWMNQRGLQLPRNSGCLWEGERRQALERKDMGSTPDSLSLPSHAFSTAQKQEPQGDEKASGVAGCAGRQQGLPCFPWTYSRALANTTPTQGF